MKFILNTLILVCIFLLSACATNEHDAAIKTAQFKALTDVNIALNKPNKIECDAKCSVEIARENRVIFTAKMMQEFSSIDRLLDGGFSLLEIAAQGVFSPQTLQAYAMYKGLETVAENGGTRITNNDSNNSHSEANQANQQTTTTETVNGIKAGGDVDQSQQNQNNPTTSTNTDDNSVNDSNNGGDDNSSTTVKEPVEAPETEETQGDN